MVVTTSSESMADYARAIVPALFALCFAQVANAGDFDGTWTGHAYDTRDVNGCADTAILELRVRDNELTGTMRQPSGRLSKVKWTLRADGTVEGDDVTGQFHQDRFKGQWHRIGKKAECLFDVSLSKQ